MDKSKKTVIYLLIFLSFILEIVGIITSASADSPAAAIWAAVAMTWTLAYGAYFYRTLPFFDEDE